MSNSKTKTPIYLVVECTKIIYGNRFVVNTGDLKMYRIFDVHRVPVYDDILKGSPILWGDTQNRTVDYKIIHMGIGYKNIPSDIKKRLKGVGLL